MDLAASVQKVTEEVMLRMTRDLAKTYGIPNLCLAGGVALNCVANGKILRDGAFKRIWVQPAAGDAGGALGAAYAAHALHAGQPRALSRRNGWDEGLLPRTRVRAIRDREPARQGRRPLQGAQRRRDMLRSTVEAWARRMPSAGSRAAWSSGRARSATARSSAIPATREMQKNLNLKIKYRESFRPFAPSVLAEDVGDYFEHHAGDDQPQRVVQMCGLEC